jgi:prefoldin subunit 5
MATKKKSITKLSIDQIIQSLKLQWEWYQENIQELQDQIDEQEIKQDKIEEALEKLEHLD